MTIHYTIRTQSAHTTQLIYQTQREFSVYNISSLFEHKPTYTRTHARLHTYTHRHSHTDWICFIIVCLQASIPYILIRKLKLLFFLVSFIFLGYLSFPFVFVYLVIRQQQQQQQQTTTSGGKSRIYIIIMQFNDLEQGKNESLRYVMRLRYHVAVRIRMSLLNIRLFDYRCFLHLYIQLLHGRRR